MQNPYFSMLRTAWKYAQSERKRFLLVYFLFILANLVVALNPLFYGWFVGEIQEKGAAVINTAWLYVGGFLGLRLVEWCFHGPARVMERKLAFNISRNYIDDLYRKVLGLPADWHQEHHSGSTISKIRKSYDALRDFFQHGFIYLYSLGKFVLSFGAILYFSPLFGAISVVIGICTVLVIIRFDKPFIRTLREVNQREHEVSSTLFDSLSNIRTVITLKLEKRIHLRLLGKVAEVFPPFRRNVTINEWKWFTAQMMVGLIYCVSVFGYLYQHWIPGETFQIAGLIILIGYVNQFTSVFNDIASQYTQIVKYHTEIRNSEDLEQPANLPDAAPPQELPASWNVLTIQNLSYERKSHKPGYSAAGLRDISMRISKGEKIALIGESGSGKSTLLSVLRGLHLAKSGTIAAVDNIPVPFADISTAITLFPQDPEIFENSIRYNITLGLPFTDDEVMEACKLASFNDVVRQLPRGLDTHIQEKGVNLSGGQKQRLALARGILAARQSDIMLFDEPTSSVDPATEKKIYAALFAKFEGRAVVSSLHRLHLLNNFDYIYVLRDGSIADEGTFEDLRRYSLVFKEMWDHRAADAEDDYPPLNVAL